MNDMYPGEPDQPIKEISFRKQALIAAACLTAFITVVSSYIIYVPIRESRELVRKVYGSDFSCHEALSPKEFIEKHAKAGHAKSQYRLGLWYLYGSEHQAPTDRDPTKALEWLTRAAEQGISEADEYLGVIYAPDLGHVAPNENVSIPTRKIIIDKGPPRDYAEAARWFLKSAEFGNINSQYYLSYLYRDGLGVPQDDQEAYFWIGLAIVGHRLKQDRYELELSRFSQKLSLDQKKVLDARIAAWRPSPVPTINQKNLSNLPWAVCNARPIDHCEADVQGDLVELRCRETFTPSCHMQVNKKTNEVEREKCAQL